MGKKTDREAKARSKHGIPDDTRIWTAENGWVTYKDGLITVKMTITPVQQIPLQDIAELEFKTPTKLTRGNLKFVRTSDTFTSRQEMIFTKDDEAGFTELRNELERDRKLGVIGELPETIKPTSVSVPAPKEALTADQRYRAKYKIPSDAVLAVSRGYGYVSFDGHYVTIQHTSWVASTGRAVKRIPLSAIAGIRIAPVSLLDMGLPYIQFSLPGANEVKGSSGERYKAARSDENSLVIGSSSDQDFQILRAAIEKAQAELNQQRVVRAVPAAAQTDDVYAQLEKLGKLRDAGILTDAEFESKKADLLAKM